VLFCQFAKNREMFCSILNFESTISVCIPFGFQTVAWSIDVSILTVAWSIDVSILTVAWSTDVIIPTNVDVSSVPITDIKLI
jgi:hypothetical protein